MLKFIIRKKPHTKLNICIDNNTIICHYGNRGLTHKAGSVLLTEMLVT